MAGPQKPFDANAEAAKAYDLSKTDPKAFQHEMDTLRQNPAHYSATVKAMETKEAGREAAYAKTESGSLHELKIVHSSPNGPVTSIYAQDVSKDHDVEKTPLPKVVLFDAATDTTHGAAKGADSPAAAAAHAEQARQEAAKKETARIGTEATGLLTNLKNHDDKGFTTEYNKLSDADKAAVGKQMMQMNSKDYESTLHIVPESDGSIRSVDRAGKLDYITPGEFLNQAIDKKAAGQLKEYCGSLSPEDRSEFITKLQAEQQKHDVTVDLDDKGNAVIKGANGKKIWDSKPESGVSKLLHQGETVVQKGGAAVTRPHY